MSRPRGRTDKSPPIIRMRKDGVTSVPPSGSACCDCRGRYPLHSHHLVIHASVYLSSRSYHSSLHSCTCITHSVALFHLFRFHSPTSLASIDPGCIHLCDSHSLSSFIHIRIDLTWVQLKNYEGRTAADYLRVHNTSRCVHTHACEYTALYPLVR